MPSIGGVSFLGFFGDHRLCRQQSGNRRRILRRGAHGLVRLNDTLRGQVSRIGPNARRRTIEADHRHPAGELGEPLLELFAIAVGTNLRLPAKRRRTQQESNIESRKVSHHGSGVTLRDARIEPKRSMNQSTKTEIYK